MSSRSSGGATARFRGPSEGLTQRRKVAKGLARQWRLLCTIASRRTGATVAELARELNTSIRTIYRDLAVLERVGVPLVTERDGGRASWRVVDTSRWALGVPMTLPEIVALRVAGRVLAASGGELWSDAVRVALDKLTARVPGSLLARLDEHLAALSVSTRGTRGVRPAVVETVARACAEARVLDMVYATPGHPRPVARIVHPYRLHVYDQGLYLLALDRRNGDVRTFLANRIREASARAERFAQPPGFDTGAHLADCLGVHRGGPVVDVAAEVAADAAHLVSERRWHPSQKLEPAEDGVVLRLRVRDTPELRAWLRSFGPSLTVLAPASLVRAMAEDARKTLANHLAPRRQRRLHLAAKRAGASADEGEERSAAVREGAGGGGEDGV